MRTRTIEAQHSKAEGVDRSTARGRRILAQSLGLIAIGAALIAMPFAMANNRYFMHLFVLVCFFVALSMSYNLLFGYVGLLSFAHPGFLGLGAYIAAILARDTNIGLIETLSIAILLSALVAFLIGVPALRLARTSFVMATLALFLSLYVISINWESVTGGSMGIAAIRDAEIALPWVGRFVIDSRLKESYLFLGYAVLVVGVVLRLVHSRFGRAVMAIRDDELLAQAYGIDTFKHKLIAFAVASSLAGGLGSLYAHYVTFVGPTVFDTSLNIRILLIVIGGGPGTILGVVVGAIFFTLLPEALQFAEAYRELAFGLAFILVVSLTPRGIATRMSELLDDIRRRKLLNAP